MKLRWPKSTPDKPKRQETSQEKFSQLKSPKKQIKQFHKQLKTREINADEAAETLGEIFSDFNDRLDVLERRRLGLTPDELWEIYGVYIKRCKNGWLPMKGILCYQPDQGMVRGTQPIQMWPTYASALAAVMAYLESTLPMNVMSKTNEMMVGRRTLEAARSSQ